MARDPNTRLVYSTGGEKEPEEPARPATGDGGGKGGIRLRLERRASGRLVTVLTGLPGGPDEVAALLRQLKTACGAGGTAKADAVEIQGDQRERIEVVLTSRGLRWKRSGG